MSLSGTGNLTENGKREVARSMFGKGCAFLAAYILLRQNDQSEATEYVALQNLCQGAEVTLKSILLFKNYDKFRPQFGKRNGLGHDLVKLANSAVKECALHDLSVQSTRELRLLNNFYGSHRLRYGTGLDLFVTPHSIARRRVVRLLYRMISLTRLELGDL